jgi:hypothetical protein
VRGSRRVSAEKQGGLFLLEFCGVLAKYSTAKANLGPASTFNQNFRRACAAYYQADQNLSGTRHAPASESNNSDVDMGDSDDGAEEVESEEELREFGHFSMSFILSFSNICLLRPPPEDAPANPQAGAPPPCCPEANLAALLSGLSLHQEAPPDDNTTMLHHFNVWNEAVAEKEQERGNNLHLTHLTVDVLLPGPTSATQIEVEVDGETILKVTYKPPSTYLKS